ncbi:helix-turn-helix domain-containing protein [Yinghuangia sp. YIM S09857]|uniref:helix-turn-helix domain-containing protein n=1 Tax=Yinghuangia sp. YIM S09857 TaxID=3436929 RepID=UPI003F534788
MAATLGQNVKNYRRRAGFNQEQLAEAASLSVATVRKVEQGRTVEMATLHKLARALNVQTSDLLAADAPVPVDGNDPNRLHLVDLRKALTPPIGLVPLSRTAEREPDLSALAGAVLDAGKLYHADQYQALAMRLPQLVRETTDAAAWFADTDGDACITALATRARVLELTGRFLTQTRQYDLAYQALAGAIGDAKAANIELTAASGINGLAWLLLRQGRFDDAESLAATTADVIEPRLSDTSPQRFAAWGWLALRAAAAAVRNNRPQVAEDYHRMAMMAAVALGAEYHDPHHQWSRFGPVTVAMKSVEATVVIGDARTALRQAEEGPLSAYGRQKAGRPSGDNWHRHRLDVAQAHVALGDFQSGMDELTYLRRCSPAWLKHQGAARSVLGDVLRKRKRTLTVEMRDMAVFLDVTG